MANEPVLLIHGGATNRSDFPRKEEVGAALDDIVSDAARTLVGGGSALETVAQAVEALEANPIFNAGYGSKLQSDGIPRLSASVMDGTRRRFGAVLNVENLCHPSKLALHLLDAEDRVLDGTGAHLLAQELGLPRRSPFTAERFQQWQQASRSSPHGTVGAVALDSDGRLAAMTSTGGKGYERPGRVSDSATPAGNYADRRVAVSCTGIGEDIMECAVAPRLAALLEGGTDLATAASAMLDELRAERRQLGVIAVDRHGNPMALFTTQCMAYRTWKGDVLDGWPR